MDYRLYSLSDNCWAIFRMAQQDSQREIIAQLEKVLVDNLWFCCPCWYRIEDLVLCFGSMGLSYSGEPFTTCENVQPSDYHTAEDFRKLTGVEFPELEMVDSLYYDENIIRANTWNEYKFVAKDGLDNTFYRRLNKACEADPSHWNYDKERNVYSYWIYPDQHPVDRSRGMCDRMVTMDDGNLVNDWDGDFISVEIQTDTIVLRKGWLK